ncbi:hypothetical protein E2C01_044752 [Portunus trituberculatus]|uniref:Uncharacterized protein n=1 Tax=Portunus trituberculatus TaxID=210409 RepID=A0A5B7FSY0_PORTR|nr:hypothetical protein [Portunus trituberculatus]
MTVLTFSIFNLVVTTYLFRMEPPKGLRNHKRVAVKTQGRRCFLYGILVLQLLDLQPKGLSFE